MAKKMKIKAKAKGDVVKVKAMFTSLMADKEEAIKKGIKASYIKYIVAKVNDAVVYEGLRTLFLSLSLKVKKVIKSFLLQSITKERNRQVRRKLNNYLKSLSQKKSIQSFASFIQK